MPNAKDITEVKKNFLIYGTTGSGKTTLFATLPGRKFAYLFDPSALESIKGLDIQYELFTPDRLDLDVISLKKEKRDNVVRKLVPETYMNWERDFDQRLDDGFFNDFDVLMFDSLTTFSDIIMDRLLYVNARPGKHPEQDDWTAQMNTISNVCRTTSALNIMTYWTAHCELVQDGVSKKIINQLIVTGKLRQKLPLLFSDVMPAVVDSDEKGIQYLLHTRPTREYPLARTSLNRKGNLELREEVTVDLNKPLEGQGLAALMERANSKQSY